MHNEKSQHKKSYKNSLFSTDFMNKLPIKSTLKIKTYE